MCKKYNRWDYTLKGELSLLDGEVSLLDGELSLLDGELTPDALIISEHGFKPECINDFKLWIG